MKKNLNQVSLNHKALSLAKIPEDYKSQFIFQALSQNYPWIRKVKRAV